MAPEPDSLPPPPPVPPGHPLYPDGVTPKRKGPEPPPRWLGNLAIVFGSLWVIGGALGALLYLASCCIMVVLPVMLVIAGIAHIKAGADCLRGDPKARFSLQTSVAAANVVQIISSSLNLMSLAGWIGYGFHQASAGRVALILVFTILPPILWIGYGVLVVSVTMRKDDRA